MGKLKKVVILHGTAGSPDGNWFRWLETELQAKGLTVWLPKLPHAEQPSLQEELTFVKSKAPFKLDEETLIVGHSSGAILALVLAGEVQRLGAVVAVAPFVPTTTPYAATIWEPNARLFDVNIDWRSVKNTKASRLIIHSDNDPYIPADVSEYIATLSNAKRIIISGQGHFNLEASKEYKKFPKLLGLLMEEGLIDHGAIQIVDAHDRPLRAGTMQEAQAKGLWHRIVRIMVEDDRGNMLLQKRADTMFMNPGKWDNSCSGHVDAGESWLEAAKRELAEEIGLKNVNLTEWQRYTYESHETDGRVLRRFNVLYRTIVPADTAFTIQPEEVSEVRWFSQDELQDLVANHPDSVTHGLTRVVKGLYESNKHTGTSKNT